MTIPIDLIQFIMANGDLEKPPGTLGLADVSDIANHSGMPWLPLRLPFKVPHEAMLTEAKELRDHFVPHRSYKEANEGWLSLCIHGLSSVHTSHKNCMLPSDYVWTDICKFCPVTHAFFRDTFGYSSYARVRFMLLKPGGFILPHTDDMSDRLNAVNIALNNPAKCKFIMEGCGVVPFEAGTANMLSLSRRHVVYNSSDEDRYHIIVHGTRDPKIWDQIVLDSYALI